MRRAASSLAIMAALMIGCSSGPVVREEPAAYVRTRDLNNRAVRFYATGDYAQAASDFREAANIGRALDDSRIAGLNTINMAASLRAAGRTDEAEAAIGAMLGETHAGYSRTDIASAHAIMAAIRMDMGMIDEASASAAEAIAACSDAKRCTFISSARLVLSRIAYDAGRTDEAERHAADALGDARAAGNPMDESNALLMIARCRLRASDYKRAALLAEEALAIDKREGATSRVALDLYEAAVAYKLSGDLQKAESYLRRARSSSLAAGNGTLTDRINLELNSIVK